MPAFLLVTAVLLAACGATAEHGASRAAGSNVISPPVVALSEVQARVAGKPVVYLFTAPGCASCTAEARALESAAQAQPSVRLVGVDLAPDGAKAFASYVSDIGLGTSRFMWTIDSDGSLARRYGIVSLSSTVFVDSGGRVRFFNPGPADAQTLSQQLRQLG